MLHPIITMLNGAEVYVDLTKSKAAQDIARQPQLLGLIKEALKGKTLTGREVFIEQDMGRVIGYDFVIVTEENDNIFYAKLLREQTYTRFVKNGKPLPTQYIAIALEISTDEQAYELRSVRMGQAIPAHPGTPGETAKSRRYWSNHAIMPGNEVLQVKTICKVCPY